MTPKTTPPSQGASASQAGASSRVDQFRGDVTGLDVPTAAAERESWLLWGGVGAVAVGIILVFVGYWGASGTADVAAQMPYLLSGGGIGLALVIVGSVLIGRYSMARLFRFWLALLVAEHRSQTDRLIEAMKGSNSGVRGQ